MGVFEITGGVTVHGNLYADALYNPTLVADSDRRLKTNVEPLLNPLEKISKLQGVYFSWRHEGEYEEYNYDDKRHVGLIAQNVQDVLPEVIESIHDDKHLAIRQLELIPLLVEGIRELDNRTNTKETENSHTRNSKSRRFAEDIDWKDNNEGGIGDVMSLQEVSDHIRQLYHMNQRLLEDNYRLFSRIEKMELDRESLLVQIDSLAQAKASVDI